MEQEEPTNEFKKRSKLSFFLFDKKTDFLLVVLCLILIVSIWNLATDSPQQSVGVLGFLISITFLITILAGSLVSWILLKAICFFNKNGKMKIIIKLFKERIRPILFFLIFISVFYLLVIKNDKANLNDVKWDEKRLADIGAIQGALDIYYGVNQDLPDSLDELSPRYIPELPVDPLNEYYYKYEYKKVSQSLYRINFRLNNDLLHGSQNGAYVASVNGVVPVYDALDTYTITLLQDALKYYYEKNGYYPNGLSQLDSYFIKNYGSSGAPKSFLPWPYNKKVCPQSGKFIYSSIDNGNSYHISFCIENAYRHLSRGYNTASPENIINFPELYLGEWRPPINLPTTYESLSTATANCSKGYVYSEKSQSCITLDQSCTEIKGPSVYRELRGGGAYCDCIDGYIWNPDILKCVK